MALSTHVLDTALGQPAEGVALALARWGDTGWCEVGRGETDSEGRCRSLLGEQTFTASIYRLRFETAPYFAAQHVTSLYPFVEIVFAVQTPEQHYHIPLLLTANGYTTYRGS